mmetsp:Transcript_13790/g.15223  ORF Transcript_13790/g.15223 Transcript_13790/m.15223 type:complete len:102 (-) Transcript_13790:21-326(-)
MIEEKAMCAQKMLAAEDAISDIFYENKRKANVNIDSVLKNVQKQAKREEEAGLIRDVMKFEKKRSRRGPSEVDTLKSLSVYRPKKKRRKINVRAKTKLVDY